jgi:hypothetical protein
LAAVPAVARERIHMKPSAMKFYKWQIRMMLVLAITGLIDVIVVWFVPHPVVWASLIGASIPLSTAVFVIIPFLIESKRKR